MKGQLWEPCPVCDTEPVCVNCGRCQRHCYCAQEAEDREVYREVNQRRPGFLDNITRHHEQGAQER